MNLSIIVAMAKNRVIGVRNRLPWRLSEDLQRFKKLTMGHPVIMGRRTFDSIGKALPGRPNFVLTRNRSFAAPDVTVVRSLEDALEQCREATEVFILGGADLFRMALPMANRLYLTLIDREVSGDTYFPDIDLAKNYEIVEESDLKNEGGFSFRFLTMTRR